MTHSNAYTSLTQGESKYNKAFLEVKMKKEYQEPQIDILEIYYDIITMSNNIGENDDDFDDENW